jgi:CheY-specific phosphatase CheX
MLGVGPDCSVEQQDVIDAVSEAVNIIAGNFKTHINDTYPALKLGLPLLAVDNPRNEHPKGQTFMRIPLVMGELRASLVVVAKATDCECVQ